MAFSLCKHVIQMDFSLEYPLKDAFWEIKVSFLLHGHAFSDPLFDTSFDVMCLLQQTIAQRGRSGDKGRSLGG